MKRPLTLVVAVTAATLLQAAPSPSEDTSPTQSVSAQAPPPQLTTGKHWKPGPDFLYLEVPGYNHVAVPDSKLKEIADVQHSAVAAAMESTGNESIQYQEFGSHPSQGLYLQSFKGTNVTEADAYAREHDVYMPITISNPTKSRMCILAEANNFNTAEVFPFTLNKTENNGRLLIAPRSMVQVGNFIPRRGEQRLNGRAEAHFDCDKTCHKCLGPKTAINTLVEWSFMRTGDQGDGFWSNLSNVDGLSVNVNMTAYNDKMESCHQRSCQTTAREVKKACPPQLFWKDGNNVGCSSQCKFTNSAEHCCLGEHNSPQTCRASSSFNSELCRDAYAWPYDDPTHVDWCGTDLKGVHLEFAPIR